LIGQEEREGWILLQKPTKWFTVQRKEDTPTAQPLDFTRYSARDYWFGVKGTFLEDVGGKSLQSGRMRLRVFRESERAWRERVSQAVRCLARDIDDLLRFLECPSSITGSSEPPTHPAKGGRGEKKGQAHRHLP
jgi:hypothetical protein